MTSEDVACFIQELNYSPIWMPEEGDVPTEMASEPETWTCGSPSEPEEWGTTQKEMTDESVNILDLKVGFPIVLLFHVFLRGV